MEDVAKEKHYTVFEVAEMWGCSHMTIRRKFANEPGVIDLGSDETRWAKKHKMLRIPESVMIRVHRERRVAG